MIVEGTLEVKCAMENKHKCFSAFSPLLSFFLVHLIEVERCALFLFTFHFTQFMIAQHWLLFIYFTKRELVKLWEPFKLWITDTEFHSKFIDQFCLFIINYDSVLKIKDLAS